MGQLNNGEFIPSRPFRLQQRPFRFNQQPQQKPQQQQRLQQQQPRIVFRPAQNPLATQQRLTVPAPQASVAFHHKKPIKKPHFEAQRQPIRFSQRQEQAPAGVYGPPQESQGIYPPPSQPEQQYGAPPQQPEQQYGAPQQQPEPESAPEFQGGDDDSEEDAEDVSGGPAISVANAVSNNGQYYILGEDNVLQRVVYMTARDQSTNGFSAKLKYEPVEPIRDPIYAYDQLGQLVRVYNK